MPSVRAKKSITKKSAKSAAKRAQRRFGKLSAGPKASTWKKGGKQWSKVMGHFGLSA